MQSGTGSQFRLSPCFLEFKFSIQLYFMTANRDKYLALQCPDTYRRMRAVEKACSERSLYHHLLKARLRQENKTYSGLMQTAGIVKTGKKRGRKAKGEIKE